MHNIKTNFGRFYRIYKAFFEDEADIKGDLQFYSKMPLMGNLEVIAFSSMIEALAIDSEHLLWSKIRKDYPSMFLHLICRTRFNWRRRRLQCYIVKVQNKVSATLEDQSQTMVIASIPVPVVKMTRERIYKSFRKSFETALAKGYSSVYISQTV